MSVDKKVPEVRFKGFSGEWEEREFSDIATRVSIHHQSTYLPCVEYEDIAAGKGRLNKDIHQKKTFKSGLKFEANDVLFGKLRPYLKNWFLADFEGLAVGDFWVLRAENITSEFLFHLIQTNKFELIANLSAGSKMPRSDWGLVSSSCFFVPKNISESNEIGDYFKKLDTLINQHQQKHDKLNSIKKAMLEKMFPKRGETMPEIRFKAFKREWDYLALGENAKFTKGQGYSKGDLVTSGSPIILYGRLYTKYQTVITVVDTFVTEKDKSVKSIGGEVIVPASGESPEDISRASVVSEPNVIIGGDLNIILPSKKIHSTFLALAISNGHLKKKLSSKAQGKSVVHIRNSDLADLDLILPTEYMEQTAISNYFQKLDALINQHQQQITKLNNIKQACLSKMFV